MDIYKYFVLIFNLLRDRSIFSPLGRNLPHLGWWDKGNL